jgi:hypothetical protein
MRTVPPLAFLDPARKMTGEYRNLFEVKQPAGYKTVGVTDDKLQEAFYASEIKIDTLDSATFPSFSEAFPYEYTVIGAVKLTTNPGGDNSSVFTFKLFDLLENVPNEQSIPPSFFYDYTWVCEETGLLTKSISSALSLALVDTLVDNDSNYGAIFAKLKLEQTGGLAAYVDGIRSLAHSSPVSFPHLISMVEQNWITSLGLYQQSGSSESIVRMTDAFRTRVSTTQLLSSFIEEAIQVRHLPPTLLEDTKEAILLEILELAAIGKLDQESFERAIL